MTQMHRRDSATGIAAFVQPQPAAATSSPLLLALAPVFWALAVIRVGLLIILLSIKLLFIDVALLFSPVPAIHRPLSHFINAVTCRLILFVLGFLWITSEEARPKARTKPANTTASKPLVVANWSSPLDVLYLILRFNCDKFLLPVVATKPQEPSPKAGMKVERVPVVGVRSVGFFKAMMATGLPAEVYKPGRKYLTLEQGIASARTGAVVFAEGTSSNNRGLLRFTDIPLGNTTSAVVQVVSLRYDTPAAFKPSATLPSPTLLNPLLHILRLVVSPFPQGLLVRTLPISDAPSLSIKGGSAAFWENAASSLASVGRWKRMPTLGAEEKVGYLAFKAKGGR